MNNLKEYSNEQLKEMFINKTITIADFVDSGICPTCFDKNNDNILYGDNADKVLYENEDYECFLVGNPRSNGHTVISSKKHYKDMMEIPDDLCEKIFVFAKVMMNIIKKVYKAESVYLCTMCDGPMNHFHIQLIPRYEFEKRGSKNFVKERKEYIEEKNKIEEIKKGINKQIKGGN